MWYFFLKRNKNMEKNENYTNIQEWVNKKYSNNNKKKKNYFLYIGEKEKLSGELDLKDFINLEEIFIDKENRKRISFFSSGKSIKIPKILETKNFQKYFEKNEEFFLNEKKIDLNHKNLEGDLIIKNSENLSSLRANYNNFFDVSVENCPKIKELFISYSNLENINSNSFPISLTTLEINNNNFIIESELFSSLINLEILKINNNEITGSLKFFFWMKKLKTLNIEYTELNDDIEFLPENLKEFYCRGTKAFVKLLKIKKNEKHCIELLYKWREINNKIIKDCIEKENIKKENDEIKRKNLILEKEIKNREINLAKKFEDEKKQENKKNIKKNIEELEKKKNKEIIEILSEIKEESKKFIFEDFLRYINNYFFLKSKSEENKNFLLKEIEIKKKQLLKIGIKEDKIEKIYINEKEINEKKKKLFEIQENEKYLLEYKNFPSNFKEIIIKTKNFLLLKENFIKRREKNIKNLCLCCDELDININNKYHSREQIAKMTSTAGKAIDTLSPIKLEAIGDVANIVNNVNRNNFIKKQSTKFKEILKNEKEIDEMNKIYIELLEIKKSFEEKNFELSVIQYINNNIINLNKNKLFHPKEKYDIYRTVENLWEEIKHIDSSNMKDSISSLKTNLIELKISIIYENEKFEFLENELKKTFNEEILEELQILII